ncbi:MAG TPA: PilZ domain-containing protein, partial [Polyangiaceae bacterium]|nr:PilZ domain-containing protein [Polyangiaceae bacterium]
IRFAVAADDAEHFASDPSLKLVVANSELMSDARAVVTTARGRGSSASFVVCAAPREISVLRSALTGLTSVTVTDGFASPENVLFVANELTSGRSSGRTSPRIPYGLSVAFRSAGREVDEHGYSYNLSERGLYVRTLALPDEDEVWLELTPPRLDRLVRLVGKVAWRRPFNNLGSATVPPGFGIEIIDGSARDRALWVESYNELSRALG